MFQSRSNSRSFKKGLDKDAQRGKRQDITISLRKKNRDEQIQKRRMGSAKPQIKQDPQQKGSFSVSTSGTHQKLTQLEVQQRIKNIGQLVAAARSNDPNQQMAATLEFRRMLSVEDNPPIQQVIDCGIVPRLLEFLTFTNNESLQFEAAWTMTNIASGTTKHTNCIVELGSVNHFVVLLGSPNVEVREQAVWALGNIAGDSPEFRDLVLNTGGSVQRMLHILDPTHNPKITMIRNATWCLSNFCRGKPRPNFALIRPIIPILAKLLMNSDAEVLTDSCWALSYITDDQTEDNIKIGAVVDQPGVCARLIHLLQNGPNNVQVPALRTIGNIVTGDDKQTQAMLNCNPLPALLGTLSRQKKSCRKETCWTLSNITAGTAEQIELLINANMIPPLVSILRESEFDVQKEAAWAISNITSGGSPHQIRFLVSQAAIPALCGMFSCEDPKIVLVCLEGIDNILKLGKKDNPTENQYSLFVEECGGLDTLEELQRHDNEGIYDKVVYMLQEFFEGDEDDEVSMAPVINEATNQFAFGVTSNAPTPQFAF